MPRSPHYAGQCRYELHDNDCRHFVNGLVNYTTGFERSTLHLLRHRYAIKCEEEQRLAAANRASSGAVADGSQGQMVHHHMAATASLTLPTFAIPDSDLGSAESLAAPASLSTPVHHSVSGVSTASMAGDDAATSGVESTVTSKRKGKVPAVWQRPIVTSLQVRKKNMRCTCHCLAC